MLEHNRQREREVRRGLIFPAGDSGASEKAGQGLGGGEWRAPPQAGRAKPVLDSGTSQRPH